MEYNLIVILGPTASGKTRLAVRLANDMRGEIISADSRQVYRGLDIGTGKDLLEYLVEGRTVPYHLIDIVHPSEEFSVFEFQTEMYRIFRTLRVKGQIPILVGGSGLYLDAVIRGYRMPAVPGDPARRFELETMDTGALMQRLRTVKTALHNTTDFADRTRMIRAIEIAEAAKRAGIEDIPEPDIHPFIVGIRWDRGTLRQRISRRLETRIGAGLIDEVRRLQQTGLSWERMESLGLEYRYVSRYLRGRMSYEDMIWELTIRIGQFAKRQMTWFRKMERQGTVIHWMDGDDYEKARALIVQNWRWVQSNDSPR